jgi:ElaB/YqjD/DUF883 family membrane-anchored ribosome-binding protein
MYEQGPESISSGLASVREARSTEEWRQDVEARKEAIAGTIRQIDRRVQRASDWRVQVGEHPFLAVGAAFAVGGLLAGVFRRKPTPRERIYDAIAESVEDIASNVRRRVVGHFTRGFTRSALKTVGAALVTKVASAYVSGKLVDEPEFADQED